MVLTALISRESVTLTFNTKPYVTSQWLSLIAGHFQANSRS